jgi:hypothetical protein
LQENEDMDGALRPAAHTDAGLDTSWRALGEAGGWFSATERIAIASETRAARSCPHCRDLKAALSPYAVDGAHTSLETSLSPVAIETIHRITTDPGQLSQRWVDELAIAGLLQEELVEMTGVIGVVTIADTLSRALSIPERVLPSANPGEPPRKSVPGTNLERGWVPMVDPDRAEGTVKVMYERVEAGAGFVFNVARALTSVPEALRDFFTAFLPNYETHGPVRPGGLDRTQVELLATSTSAYNDCFY